MSICNHDPNDKSTSLRKINKRILVVPKTVFYICDCCNEGFRFIKNSDGKLEIDNENN